VRPPGSADTVCPRPPLNLTFDCLTLKLVCESHLRWGTFLPNLDTLGLWVLQLFATYATDGQTDGRTDKSNAYCPLSYCRGHNRLVDDTSRHAICQFSVRAASVCCTKQTSCGLEGPQFPLRRNRMKYIFRRRGY